MQYVLQCFGGGRRVGGKVQDGRLGLGEVTGGGDVGRDVTAQVIDQVTDVRGHWLHVPFAITQNTLPKRKGNSAVIEIDLSKKVLIGLEETRQSID